MSIVVKEPDQKDFELPDDGSYLGVIADVIDLGEVKTGFGVKAKVQIKWLLDACNSEGYQFHVSCFYTASLHEKANLRKALKAILGADVSGQFDLEELLGINNQLVIQQNTATDGKIYANVVAILKAPKGQRLEIPADFVRKSEKDGEKQKQAAPKKPQPQMKQPATPLVRKPAPAPAPAPVQQVDDGDQEQEDYDTRMAAENEQAEVAEPTPPVRQAAPANRAGTIRQARTVTPAPAVAPQPARQPARQARTAPVAPAVTQEITDEDIPF